QRIERQTSNLRAEVRLLPGPNRTAWLRDLAQSCGAICATGAESAVPCGHRCGPRKIEPQQLSSAWQADRVSRDGIVKSRWGVADRASSATREPRHDDRPGCLGAACERGATPRNLGLGPESRDIHPFRELSSAVSCERSSLNRRTPRL